MFKTSLLVMAPMYFLLPAADFHFSSIVRRHCCALYPFLKRHWCLDKNMLIYSFFWRNMHRPNILGTLGRILTGLQLSLNSFFRTDRNSDLVTDVLKLEWKKLAKWSAFSLKAHRQISKIQLLQFRLLQVLFLLNLLKCAEGQTCSLKINTDLWHKITIPAY